MDFLRCGLSHLAQEVAQFYSDVQDICGSLALKRSSAGLVPWRLICLAGRTLLPDTTLQVVEKWEAVTEVDVQTPLEVYQELKGEQPPYPVGKCCSVGQAHCRQLAAKLLGNSKSCLRLKGRASACNWTPTEAALL